MESMSIFTFRKKMLTKKIRLFGFSIFFNIRYHTCGGVYVYFSERVHKKNAEFLVIWEYFVYKFGEMERNERLLLVSITMVRLFFTFNALTPYYPALAFYANK
jgi:hypothetical protein